MAGCRCRWICRSRRRRRRAGRAGGRRAVSLMRVRHRETNRVVQFTLRLRTQTVSMLMLIHYNQYTAHRPDLGGGTACEMPVFSVAFYTRPADLDSVLLLCAQMPFRPSSLRKKIDLGNTRRRVLDLMAAGACREILGGNKKKVRGKRESLDLWVKKARVAISILGDEPQIFTLDRPIFHSRPYSI